MLTSKDRFGHVLSAMSHQVTCTACQTTVVGEEQRRLHYRSDLHLVNLKRKVAGLGPLTSSEFASRLSVLQQSKLAAAPGDKKRRGPREKFSCSICRKTFSSHQALRNHEKSRRHIDTLNARSANVSVVSEEVDSNWQSEYPDAHEEMDSELAVDATNNLNDLDDADDSDMDDDNEDVDQELENRMKAWNENGSDSRSAIDDAQFSTADAALQYMQRKYGLFVPYAERLVDKEGLVRYLSQKVSIGYACIACDKGFSSITDVRKHMRDLGHCRLPADDDGFSDEFAEFYDWNTQSDQTAGETDDDDEGWEEVGAADDYNGELDGVASGQVVVINGGDDGGENGISSVEPPVGRLDAGPKDDDGEDACALVVGNKVIGHRSLVRYYRQGSGQHVDNRDAVVAHRKGGRTLDLATIRSMKRTPLDEKLTGRKHARKQQQRFELMVGRKNYYVRKSRFKQKMGVLNSGYRP